MLASPQAAVGAGEFLFWILGRRPWRGDLRLAEVRRVLVLRLDEIGDVVLTTPFLRELRRDLPDAWITLVVKPAVYNLVELCPYVNEVLTYDWSTHGRLWQLRRHWRALRLASRHLWRRRFDLAIVPRWDVDWYHAGFLVYFSGARWRVAYSEDVIALKQRLDVSYDSLFTHVVRDDTLKHEVERSLALIPFLGGRVKEDRLELWVGEEDEAFASRVFKEYGVQAGELVVAFGPSGGNSALKQWPVSNFVELGRWLQRKYGARILVVGGPGEEALGWEIEHGLGSSVINVVGKTTLRQMEGLLKLCHLYVGNDAGPMHVAAAIGVPVVALFGSSCHHRFGPWGKEHKILWLALPCSPCFQVHHPDRCGRCIFDRPHCILGLTVEQVKEAVVAQLLQQSDSAYLQNATVKRDPYALSNRE